MFWFLHYTTKLLLVAALVALVYLTGGYLVRRWWAPAEEWVYTLRRADIQRLEVLGTNEGRVVRVPTGDIVTVRDTQGAKLAFRLAGISAPPRLGQRHSPAWKAFERSRDQLSELALSNDVQVAFTFLVPGAGGLGGVYLGGTNLAIPLLEAGMVVVDDASLKGLPVAVQVRMLAAEKAARESRRGFWADAVNPAIRLPNRAASGRGS